MSHQPPIPAGNTTPYPRQFAPHEAAGVGARAGDGAGEAADSGTSDRSSDETNDNRPVDGKGEKRSWAGISGKAALGAAAGIGSAAILAALLYTGRKRGGRAD